MKTVAQTLSEIGIDNLSAGQIARRVASQFWPDVQSQRKLATGAYELDCAGHGGIIGMVADMADLAEETIDAARRHGLIEPIAVAVGWRRARRRVRIYTGARYSDSALRSFASDYPSTVRLLDVWVGEEDCDWATIALASASVRKALTHTAIEEVVGCVQRWNPDFYRDVASSLA